MFFRMHLMDQLNIQYDNDDKVPIFYALGIPNLDLVKYVISKHLKTKPTDVCKDNTEETTKIKLFAEYFGGHRLSETTIDKIFADTLNELYAEKFDGYLSPKKWSSCHHNIFLPEICLFKPKNVLTFISQTDYILLPKIGGAIQDDWIPPWNSHAYITPLSIEDFNKERLAKLTKMKWDKPIEFDDEGKIKWPNYIELTKNSIDKMFDTVNDKNNEQQTGGKKRVSRKQIKSK